MDAIIYIRWSSLEQTRGDSRTRQIHNCTKFCNDRGYNVLETVVDEGRSAWTGDNIHTGNLGRLVERFQRREIPDGTVIVVEQLDRLTRLPALDVIAWLMKVFPYGIRFVTSDRGTMISREAMDADQLSVISLVFDSFRSHGESDRKSKLLLDSWRDRRNDFAEGKRKRISSVCPAWLRWDAAQDQFFTRSHPTDPHLDRPGIIKRIFDEADAGVGLTVIARRLNEDGVPTWGEGKRASDGWHHSYIHKIVRNPAVIGEFQPHKRGKADAKGTPVGSTIPDYYPQVISNAQFERVAARRRTINVGGAMKNRQNLLSGLIYCGKCGRRMVWLKKCNPGRKRVNPNTGTVTIDKSASIYMRCSGAHRGHLCDHKTNFSYPPIQQGLLDNMLKLALSDDHFSQQHQSIQLSDDLAAARREHARLEAQAEEALTMTLDTAFRHDERVKRRYADLSRQADEQNAVVLRLESNLAAAKGKVSPAEHLKRVADVRAAIDSEDDRVRDAARGKVMEALQQMVDGIRFMADRTIIVSALEGHVGFKFDDKGKLLAPPIDLTIGLHEPALRAGLQRRDNIDRQDIAAAVEQYSKRRKASL